MTNEEHAQDFMQYVAKNEARLKKNLQKNITYDPNLFDDVFQDSIIKVYNAIMSGKRIEDFEKYFFITSKFHFINEQNKDRKRKKSDDNEYLWRLSHGYECGINGNLTVDTQRVFDKITANDNEWAEKEERNNKINNLVRHLSDILNEQFTPAETDIFLIYFRLKTEKAGISYHKMAKITGRKFSEIASIIQKIKQYCRTDRKIIELKKNLLK